MIDELDLILDAAREPEPGDDMFVARVMSEVSRRDVPWHRRRLRRPVVVSIAAAVVATGGAVAALVGTNPLSSGDTPTPGVSRAEVAVDAPAPDRRDAIAQRVTDAAEDAARVRAAVADARTGTANASDHTSVALDPNTGLALTTETYTARFAAGQPRRVTLTLENTGKDPIVFSAPEGCGLQVSAFASSSDAARGAPPRDVRDTHCAAPAVGERSVPSERFILAPGESRIAHAMVTLPRMGRWYIVGMCRCSYTKLEGSSDRNAPLLDVTRSGGPVPLDSRAHGKNLVTPPIRVDAT